MPKLLIVAATPGEIAPLLTAHKISVTGGGLFQPEQQPSDLYVLITGAGMVNMAFELGKLIGTHFDLAVNAGIAGSFNKFEKGDVVNVVQDCFSELGAEDDQKFLPVDDLGLGTQNIQPAQLFQNDFVKKLPATNAITVNTVHGNEKSIARIVERYQPHVESMEGAAFFLAANAFNWKCLQLRAISNRVTKRDRGDWDIGLAVKNLNEVLSGLIESLRPAAG